MPSLYSTGRRMIFASNSSATAASYSAGFKATLPSETFPMGASPKGERYRGIRLSFYGSAAGATLGAKVWCLFPAISTDNRVRGYEAQCIATITGTSPAATPTIPTGHAGTATQIIYDSLTVAATTDGTATKGPGSAINTALGSAGPIATNPNDDATPAMVIIPDCCNPSDIYVETWVSSGTVNGFIEGLV